jgi:hypothetical protein
MTDITDQIYGASKLTMQSPAIYQIEVQGKLNSTWSDKLAGMNITTYTQDENVTTLVGKLIDQAALSGLLQTLYELRLPILFVEYKR